MGSVLGSPDSEKLPYSQIQHFGEPQMTYSLNSLKGGLGLNPFKLNLKTQALKP